jgi:hypothetical protein
VGHSVTVTVVVTVSSEMVLVNNHESRTWNLRRGRRLTMSRAASCGMSRAVRLLGLLCERELTAEKLTDKGSNQLLTICDIEGKGCYKSVG